MILVDAIGADLCVRFVQTLIHFLWQGLLIAVAVAGLNVIAQRRSAAFRYRAAATALLLMAACLPATFFAIAPEAPHVAVQQRQNNAIPEESTRQVDSPIDSFVPLEAAPSTDAPQIAERAISAAGEPPRQTSSQFWVAASPYIVGIYVVGVLLMMMRLAIAFGGGERLRRSSLPIEESHVLEVLRGKAVELGLRAVPAIACCDRVLTPIIVGVFKPTILLPVCLLSELSLAQMEAVLAHELAHIRRWDHVANLAQRVIESLLFFHPAVWYVSRCISKERENCCDDIVLASGAEAAGYAELLVRISEMNQARGRQSVAALAASDSHPSRLHERVVRVLGGAIETPFRLRRALTSAFAVTFTLIAIGALCIHAAGERDSRFPDFDFNDPPAAYEKEIRAADARHTIKAGSLRFQLSEFNRGKDGSLEASLGLPKGYEVVSFRLFDHAKRKLIHDSHWQLNKDNDPSTRKFHVERIGETARITIRETGGDLPAEIDLWLRVVENGDGKPIVIPAKKGAAVKVGDTEIVVASLQAGSMSGKSDATGQMVWDASSALATKWNTTIDLQNRGEDLRGRYHLVAVTKSGWRHAMDHKHFLEFPRHRGRFDYVQLDVGLDDIDHFELVPFEERHKFFFNAVSVPPPLPQIGSTVERWIDDQLNRVGNNFLDFETGTVLKLPAAHWETTPPGKDAEQWIAASGVDAIGDFRSGLMLLRSKAKLIDGKWEAITIDDVERTLADGVFNSKALYLVDRLHDPDGKKFRDGQGLLAPPRRDESAIHAFETSDGTIGIIQIVAVDQKTKRQQVRYKLFKVATAADKAVETDLRPGPAALSGSEQYVAGQPIELRLKTMGGAEWQLDQSRGEIDSDEHWACYVRINDKDYRCRSAYFPFSGPIASTLTLPGDLQDASPFSPGFYRVSYVWKDIDVIRTSDARQTHLDEYVSEACSFSVVQELEALWGEAVDGVRAMLAVEQRDWTVGETPALKAMIRNGGQSDYQVAQAQQLCELEVNGRRYRWVGTIRVRSSTFPPGKQFENIPITLDGSWHDKKTDGPLKLDVGRHTIRLAFTPTRPETGRTVVAPFLVFSNPVEVRVVTKKAVVGWGPAIERELTIDADQATAYLNLKSGKHVTPTWDAFPDAKTLRAAGVDVYHASILSNHTQKVCSDVEFLNVEDGWELTASKIHQLLDRAKLAKKTKQGILDPKVTYLFETRDGSRGVLELVPDKINPTVLTVRYKLVTKGSENKPDATNDERRTDDGTRKLIGAWSGGQKVMQRLVLRADGTFDLSYPKTPRIVDVIPESGVWSRDGKTLTLEITKSADKDRVGKKVAREVVYLTEEGLFLRAEDGICTHFTQAKVFHGWTLLPWFASISNEDLPDFWEERPAGSKSYEIHPDVDVIYSGIDGTVRYRADKKLFLIQCDPIGSGVQTFYGPFEGDPRELLKLSEREKADAKDSERSRDDFPRTNRHVVTGASLDEVAFLNMDMGRLESASQHPDLEDTVGLSEWLTEKGFDAIVRVPQLIPHGLKVVQIDRRQWNHGDRNKAFTSLATQATTPERLFSGSEEGMSYLVRTSDGTHFILTLQHITDQPERQIVISYERVASESVGSPQSNKGDSLDKGVSAQELASIALVWTCLLHQQVQVSQPGECPLCGKALVSTKSSPTGESLDSATAFAFTPLLEVDVEHDGAASNGEPSAENEVARTWTCPEHKLLYVGRSGECPHCGRELVAMRVVKGDRRTLGSPLSSTGETARVINSADEGVGGAKIQAATKDTISQQRASATANP